MRVEITRYGKENYGRDVVELLGIIPHWAEAYERGHIAGSPEDLVDFFLKAYGFPRDPMVGSKVGSRGQLCSSYEEDPDLEPVGITYMERLQLKIYSYEYGIVGFLSEDQTLNTVYRFD